MKLNLKAVKDLGEPAYVQKEKDMDKIIETWINKVIVPKIEEKWAKAKRNEKKFLVGAEPPKEANTYVNSESEYFYKRLNEVLKPLGYTAEKSHDGGGQHEVTHIKWVLPVMRTPAK